MRHLYCTLVIGYLLCLNVLFNVLLLIYTFEPSGCHYIQGNVAHKNVGLFRKINKHSPTAFSAAICR